MQLKHNILKLYLLRGFLWFMVSMPIIVLFFQENGLNLMEVMILQSVYSFTIAITEIPSGYIADYFGRKNSLILGTVLTFCGYLIFSNFSSFEIFICAQIIIAIGGSLMSGADSALMYDTLLETEDEKHYTKVEGRTYAIGNFSEAVAGLLGGFLATTSLLLPVQVQTSILFICIPIAISLVEPSLHKKDKIEKGFYSIIKVVRYSLLENTKLRWLIIYSSIMGVATLSAAWLAQPFFKSIDIPIVYYGVLWATLNITAGISSINSYKHEQKYNTPKLLLILGLLMSLSFIIIYFTPNYFGLILIFAIYYLRGILTPLLKNQININTESNIRATVMSVRSFILRIGFAITAPILGYLADNISISHSFLILSVLIIILSSLSSVRLKNSFR
ncbi:MAG: MFS transporter [Flavobacteriales bacterium]|nr:MFS transporter [Flavobacteriales bacterium]